MLPTRRDMLQTAAALTGVIIAPRAAGAEQGCDGILPRSTRLADWRFHLGHAADQARDFGFGRDQRTFAKAGAATADAARADFDDIGWQRIQVPHDWAVELPFAKPGMPASKASADAVAAHGFKAIGRDHPENSIGWYRTPIAVRPGDAGRSLWLSFDGVFRDCIVFINGYVVATNASGYAPFSVPIGDFLDYDGGPNVLAVRCDASLGEGWFYEGAGLYRHVDLLRAERVHVAHHGSVVRSVIGPDGATVSATIEIANDSGADAVVELRHAVVDAAGHEIATAPGAPLSVPAGGAAVSATSLIVRAPQLWSIETPHLYRLHSELLVGGAVVDRYDTPFGIRTIRFDPAQGFFLNGTPTKLLGTCNHQDHAGVGTGIPDALHAWRIDQLKDMGSNAWRSAHNPPAAAMLDLCDAKGMLMIVEARRNSSDAQSIAELERIVRRDRNHPCVIAWSLGNEEPHQGTARGARVTAAMQAHVRALDATRLTTFAFDNNWDRGAAKVVDLVGFNYRTDQMQAFHAVNPQVPIYGSETGSTVATRGAYANDATAHVVRAYDTEYPWWASTAEAWWSIAATRPYIAGGFIWTGFDYRGEPTPYPQFPSISSYFGVLDTCGFAKDNYHYYRAWWRPNVPQVHVLPHWTWPGRDGQEIEVWVHGNCDEVELLHNGRSIGRKAMPRNGHLAWRVSYAPGRIEARGFNSGRRVATSVRETVGEATRVMLTADRRLAVADGSDVVMLRAEVADAKRRPVPDAATPLRFSVTGDAKVIGVGNGDPTSLEADVASERRAFNGLAQAILRIGRTAGVVRVVVTGDGLAEGRVMVLAAPHAK